MSVSRASAKPEAAVNSATSAPKARSSLRVVEPEGESIALSISGSEGPGCSLCVGRVPSGASGMREGPA